jgi:sugar lactone lactonase YvrE
MTVSSIQCVARTADVCGEGAVWHAAHNAIYWTDINRSLLHRYSLHLRHVDTWQFNQPVIALTLTTDPDRLLVVLGGEILLWSPADDRREEPLFRLPDWPLIRCNEARVDPEGVLWFGTMQNNVSPDGSTQPVTAHIGSLLSLRSDGAIRHWQDGIGIPNTIVWSPAGNTMLMGDTLRNEIWRFEYERENQDISNRVVFIADWERGLPDGSAMDADGFLWNCRYGGGCIVRFDPNGRVAQVIETPVPNPTTCAFGGEDQQTLYFTSAGEGIQPAGPEDGGLFSMQTDVQGLPCAPFRLRV